MADGMVQVLLVEDNPGDARLLREILAESDPGYFRVRHVASLGDALSSLAGETAYAVVLLDLSLPDSSGLDTVARVRRAGPGLPIVVLTGLDDEQLGIEAIRAGAEDYLVKGQVDSRILARTIRYAVERNALKAERERLLEALRQARDHLEQRVRERTTDLRRSVEILEAEVRARMKAEEAFRSSEARLRLLLQQIPALIWTTNTELSVTSSYGSGPDTLKVRLDEPVSQMASVEVWRQPIISSHRSALRGEPAAFDLESEGRAYHCHVEPLRGHDDIVVGCLGIALDISEHRAMEEQRATLQAQLHTAHKVEMIGRLAAGLSHDFGNVLATVAGYSSVAKAHLPDDHPACRALETIEESARQARGITNALLAFGRQSFGEKKPLNLCAAMEESVRLLRHTLAASIELITSGCEPPVWVLADPVQLQQILLNLALNAKDAMPSGGKLEISVSPAEEADARALAEETRHPEHVARLVVRDTGAGIPADVQPHIFEPFFSTKPRGQGAGLGLSIIHGIVEGLGGRIRVASAAGTGTTFTILLPCVAPPPSADEAAAADAAVKRDGVIVLADDNRHIRGVVAAALGSLGYDVEQADDREAMAAYCSEHGARVRLLIVSCGVLQNGGLDCVRSIRRDIERLPMIIMADGGGPEMEDGLRTDTTILRRPFQMSDLRKVVRDVLGT